jgi:hypothetical protein
MTNIKDQNENISNDGISKLELEALEKKRVEVIIVKLLKIS